jgi:hypothetical protein
MGSIISKILGAPSALLRGFAERYLIGWLRGGIEGAHGAFLQRVLLAVQGGKTITGLALGFVTWAGVDLGMSAGLTVALASVSAILVAVGLADKGLAQPGRPEALAEAPLYRALADNAGLLATLLTSAFASAAGPSCVAWEIRSLSLSCSGQSYLLLVAALALVYIGILDTGFLSRMPQRPGA